MKDINCIELFKTPVFYYDLDLNTKALNKFCYGYQKKNKKSRVISNVGSYQSNNLNLNHKLLKPIVKYLNASLSNLSLSIFKFKYPAQITNMWFNINPPKGYNLQHAHPSSVISGVFYLECEINSGRIVFVRETDKGWVYTSDKIKDFNEYNSSEWKVPPKTESCFIFPSDLQHYVEQNQSKKDRISFSFNANFNQHQ